MGLPKKKLLLHFGYWGEILVFSEGGGGGNSFLASIFWSFRFGGESEWGRRRRKKKRKNLHYDFENLVLSLSGFI